MFSPLTWSSLICFSTRFLYDQTPQKGRVSKHTLCQEKDISSSVFLFSAPSPPLPLSRACQLQLKSYIQPYSQSWGGEAEKRETGESGPSGRRRPIQKEKKKSIHLLLNKLQPSLHSHNRFRFILRQQNRSYQFINLARALFI